jgi:hypothetical protein
MKLVAGKKSLASRSSRSGEQGWALLGLMLALAVMSIFLVSSITPDVQKQVLRDKEAEMLYRGQQMAEGIARYYGNGALQQLRIPILQGPRALTELAKLRDGITIGAIEKKFVRPSAMFDPVSGDEWQVVRPRDPRLAKFLQAWMAETLIDLSRTDYPILAGPPQKSAFKKNGLFTQDQAPSGGAQVQPSPATNPPNQQNPPPNPGGSQIRPLPKNGDDDDDDDDDDVAKDPLTNLFTGGSPGHSNIPIIGVAPKKKGKAMTAYYGLENYEDWVFIYIPRNIQQPPGPNRAPGGQQLQPLPPGGQGRPSRVVVP